MKPRALQQGFTLVQISILLLVASLVLVTILPSTRTSLSANTTTTAQMNNLLTAMRQYETTHAALPCPADASQPISGTSYGVAASGIGTTNNCTGGSPAANYVDSTNHVAVGMVPVRTLGLSNAYALDAFGRDITYAVDTNATSCFTGGLVGQITVTDNGTANSTVAALVSHGADGHGAWIPLPGSTGTAVRLNAGSTDANTLLNAHVNSSFAATTPLTNFVRSPLTSTFDDLVVYKNPLWTLNNAPVASSSQWPTLSPPVNGTYHSGQVLSFSVSWLQPVTVTGTPYLSLSAITGSIGTGNVAKATYQSGSGTATLTFSYTVVAADSAPTGLTIASSVSLNGGTITVTGDPTCLTFSAQNLTGILIINTSIYVGDYTNNRVQIFNMSGTYLSQFPCASGACTGSSANGQLRGPTDIRVDSSGNIWVAELTNNRVQKFNSSHTFLLGVGDGYQGVAGAIGSSSIGNGGFSQPIYLAIDSSGNVWVTDFNNNRVEEFNSSGTYLAAIGAGYNGVAGSVGSSGTGSGQLSGPQAIAFDSSGNIWVVDGNNNRVQKFNSSRTYLSQFPCASGACTGSSANGQFHNPQGIAFDSSGNIWVTDYSNFRMQKFNSSATFILGVGAGYQGVGGAIGSNGTANGQFNNPNDIAIDLSGNVWVADGGGGAGSGNRLEEFNSSGIFLMGIGAGYNGVSGSIDSTGTASGQFNLPFNLTIGSR
jgi:hypothetical protein